MPSNQTQNYQLSQWSKDDRVLMDDFNADNAKIDAAIAAVAARKAEQSDLAALTALVGTPVRMASGYYAGDGAASRFISVGFTPKAVFVMPDNIYISSTNTISGTTTYRGGLAVTGSPASTSSTNIVVEVVTGGFKAHGGSNQSGSKYNYIALG